MDGFISLTRVNTGHTDSPGPAASPAPSSDSVSWTTHLSSSSHTCQTPWSLKLEAQDDKRWVGAVLWPWGKMGVGLGCTPSSKFLVSLELCQAGLEGVGGTGILGTCPGVLETKSFRGGARGGGMGEEGRGLTVRMVREVCSSHRSRLRPGPERGSENLPSGDSGSSDLEISLGGLQSVSLARINPNREYDSSR